MFFTAIHQMMTESVDLTLVIRKANGQLTVSMLPKSNGLKDEAQNHLVPLTVSGLPQELDAGFLQSVARPIQKTAGLISNMAQFEAQAEKAASESKAAKETKAKETKEEKEKRKEDELVAVARDIFGRQDFITYVDLAEQIQAILDVKERTAKSYIKFMREKEIIRKDPSNQSYYIIGNLKQAGL